MTRDEYTYHFREGKRQGLSDDDAADYATALIEEPELCRYDGEVMRLAGGRWSCPHCGATRPIGDRAGYYDRQELEEAMLAARLAGVLF